MIKSCVTESYLVLFGYNNIKQPRFGRLNSDHENAQKGYNRLQGELYTAQCDDGT